MKPLVNYEAVNHYAPSHSCCTYPDPLRARGISIGR